MPLGLRVLHTADITHRDTRNYTISEFVIHILIICPSRLVQVAILNSI